MGFRSDRLAGRQTSARFALVMLVALAFALASTLVAVPSATAAKPPAPEGVAPEPEDGEPSAISTLMFDVAKGAAGQLGSSLVGWVLGSSGSADQELAVMNEILDELDTIENTLIDIENELGELIGAVNRLDCDTWVEDAAPYVNAISNLWDPDSVASQGDGPPPQQSYKGMIAEAQTNTLTVEDMQVWVDQVLDNSGTGTSVLDYLQDLGNALIPQGGGSGVLKSCLSVTENLPSAFSGKTDDTYYETAVAPLVNYYYGIQAQGVTMVVEALNFEAWQAAGSPISTTENIQQLPESICGPSATGQVLQYCQNSSWAVLGIDGQSGVRGRVAAQFAAGGAPYTTALGSGAEPVHRYVGSKNLWVSDPKDFNTRNSTNCSDLDSNDPCGILAGIYSNTKVGGTYGGYGAGFGGTWAASGQPQMREIFSTGPKYGTSYTNVGDYLMKERRFTALPNNTIFITNDVFSVKPYSNMSVTTDVIAFTDTGLRPQYFQPMYDKSTQYDYISPSGLQYRTSSPACQFFATNKQLPPNSANASFYYGGAEFCPNNEGWWTAGPPGWTIDVGAANKHPQFRLPTIDVTTLTCSAGAAATNLVGATSMCGSDFYAWLDAQVPPPAPRDEIADPCNQNKHRVVAADGTTRCVPERPKKRPVVTSPEPSPEGEGMTMEGTTDDFGDVREKKMKQRVGQGRARGFDPSGG